MNRLSRVVVVAVLAAGVMLPGAGTSAVVEASQVPSSVQVCLDSSSGVVSRMAISSVCIGEIQNWSALNRAPLLCWDASSLSRLNRTRLVSAAPLAGCVSPLSLVPVGQVSLLCAGRVSGVLRWPVTGTCRFGNQDVFVRPASAPATMPATPATPITMPATPTTAALVPSVSLSATLIDSGKFPKAAVVTANVAGRVYFIEGSSPVNTVSDITSARFERWTSGLVAANTPTSIALDVDVLSNGYYRVFVANNQGVLSAPAFNKVTISIPRISNVAITSTTAPLSCAAGGVCDYGDTGPGGGVVFYVASSNFTSTGSTCNTTCRYMEAAPIGWIAAPAGQTNCVTAGSSTVDPKCVWSGNTADRLWTTSALIGKGHANTTAMIAQPTGGDTAGKAATASRAYRGGGKTDWFLPSKDELNQMCKWQRGVAWISDATVCTGGVSNSGRGAGGFSNDITANDIYWTSTADGAWDVWFQFFNSGAQSKDSFGGKREAFYVRPARAF